MYAITLARSPRFSSRSSTLLEYAQERLRGQGVEVLHWNLHNFPPEDLIYARFDSPVLNTFTEQLQDTDGLIVAIPVYRAAYSGALKTLLDLLPERALEGEVVSPLATGGSVAHLLAVDYALKPVLSVLKAQEILHGVFADGPQVIDYQRKPQFMSNLQQRLDSVLDIFWLALHRRDVQLPQLNTLRGTAHARSSQASHVMAGVDQVVAVVNFGACRRIGPRRPAYWLPKRKRQYDAGQKPSATRETLSTD